MCVYASGALQAWPHHQNFPADCFNNAICMRWLWAPKEGTLGMYVLYVHFQCDEEWRKNRTSASGKKKGPLKKNNRIQSDRKLGGGNQMPCNPQA
jgi:hypothetical protein